MGNFHSTPMSVVIGDIGGTNSRLELIAADAPRGCRPNGSFVEFKRNYRSGTHPSLLQMLVEFTADASSATATSSKAPILFSLSVCGPVTRGKSILLAPCFGPEGWTLDQDELSQALGAPVVLLNDFHSVGLSLPKIPPENLHPVYEGKDSECKEGVIACLGPGSGLGEVYGVPGRGGYHICCSEGGMSEFVARTGVEWELITWLRPKCQQAYVEVEKVVSGEGIKNIYHFLRETRPELIVNESLDAEIVAAGDLCAALVSKHGDTTTATSDPVCAQAIDIFLEALGAEAANLAIRYQALGGVFIAGGGIAGKMLNRVMDGTVARAYLGKGHSVACYDSCPLYVTSVPGDELGMSGAWEFAHMNMPAAPTAIVCDICPRPFSTCEYGDVRVEVYADEGECAEVAAAAIMQAARAKPDLLLCLASGASPTKTYSLLAEYHKMNSDSLSEVRALKLDEWYGVQLDSPVSCESYLRQHVLDPLGIPPETDQQTKARYVGFRSDAEDPKAECARVHEELQALGWSDSTGKGIDIAVLGLGKNGHIGFNEPAQAATGPPHSAVLQQITQQHPMLDAAEEAEEAPTHGLTMGMDHLRQAEKVLLLVLGAPKAEMLRTILEEPISSQRPASLLRAMQGGRTGHAVRCICDPAAAKLLSDVRRATAL